VIEASERSSAELLKGLEHLAAESKSLDLSLLTPVEEVGVEDGRLWAACRAIHGRTAAEWIVHHGRFPPQAVLEIARQMMPALVALETSGMVHGDIRATTLVLEDAGAPYRRAVLPQPGLRAAVRPVEGYAHADLPPEAFDGLAPERIREPLPPSTRSDVYACGCLWWHLLTGRSPLPGGNALVKLRAAEAAEIADVRRLAPDTPEPLAAAIASCLGREPERRCESMEHLAAMLGPATRRGSAILRRCLAQGADRPARWSVPLPAISEMPAARRSPLWLAVAIACVSAAAAVAWAVSRGGLPGTVPAESPTAPLAQPVSTVARPPSAVQDRSTQPGAAVPQGIPEKESQPTGPGAKTSTRDDAKDLVLGSGGPLAVDVLAIKPGQRVHGGPGKRPMLMVPRAGLVVAAPDVRFENVDFTWDHPDDPADGSAAIVRLQASGVEFRGCTFRSTRPATDAIRWIHPVDRAAAKTTLPSGQVRLEDCVFRGVGAAVDCRTVGAVAVTMANTLALGDGPLIRLDHVPEADEPVSIDLARTTLRECGPLVECRQGKPTSPGKILIRTIGCALLPREGSALLRFAGDDSPEPLLGQITWEGQGSLVGPRAVIAAWQHPDGRSETLNDAAVSIDGLARSDVDFAGPAGPDPATSRITRWQAPLRSTDPPGIDPERLPKPRGGEGKP
jgi:hypothetical protein